MKPFGVFSILLFPLALGAATVRTVDGKLEGRLASMTPREVCIEAGEKRITIPLTKIIRANLAPVSANRSPVLIVFSNGDRIRAAAVLLSGTTLKVKSSFFETPFPTGELSLIRFSEIPEAELENARSTQHDVVFLTTPSGKVDRVRGLIASIGEKEVKIETDGGTFAVEKSKVKAIAFVRLPVPAPEKYPLTFTLRDGTRIRGALGTGGKGLELLQGERKIPVPLEALAQIENISLGLTRLEELPFKTVRGRVWPVFPLPPARNKSLWGGVLSLGGRRFERGLSAQSATELTFALEGRYERLVGVAGIDDEVRTSGRVVITVLADSKKAAELELRFGHTAQINAPLKGAKLLTLKIQDGGDGNLGDHVDFVDCVLVKK